MYTILSVSDTQEGDVPQPCLYCKKNVAMTAALGTLAVRDSKDHIVGYLHPGCKEKWQTVQQKTESETNAPETTSETPKHSQVSEPRQQPKYQYVVIVQHNERGTVRIETDVVDEGNAVTQAERRNPGPGYDWDSASVERIPLR